MYEVKDGCFLHHHLASGNSLSSLDSNVNSRDAAKNNSVGKTKILSGNSIEGEDKEDKTSLGLQNFETMQQ